MRFLILLLAATLGAAAAHAEVYRYTDENGNVVYTDEPRDQAERIVVKKIPTINMPDGPLTEDAFRQSPDTEENVPSPELYKLIGFSEPQNNSAFWSGSGNIAIAVEAVPGLRPSHGFQVLLDGEPIGTGASGLFSVQHIDRGTHTATVRVVNADGDVLQTGQSITFTVHRPSVIN